MNKLKNCIVLAAILAVTACMNPFSSGLTDEVEQDAALTEGGAALVRVSVHNNAEVVGTAAPASLRTVLPGTPDFSRVRLEFTSQDGADEPDPVYSDELAGIEVYLSPGDWIIKAFGYVDLGGSDVVAAEGSSSVSLEQGQSTDINIELLASMEGENGSFSWTIHVPEGLGTVGYSVEIRSFTNRNQSEADELLEGTTAADGTAAGSHELSPGYYLVTVVAQADEDRAIREEIVHVYARLDSAAEFSFSHTDFQRHITVSGSLELTVDGVEQNPDDYFIGFMTDPNDWGSLFTGMILVENGMWEVSIPGFFEETEAYVIVAQAADVNQSLPFQQFLLYLDQTIQLYDSDVIGVQLEETVQTIGISGTGSIEVGSETFSLSEFFDSYRISAYVMPDPDDHSVFGIVGQVVADTDQWEMRVKPYTESTTVYLHLSGERNADWSDFELVPVEIHNQDVSGVHLQFDVGSRLFLSGNVEFANIPDGLNIENMISAKVYAHCQNVGSVGYSEIDPDLRWLMFLEDSEDEMTVDFTTIVSFHGYSYAYSHDTGASVSISDTGISDISLEFDFSEAHFGIEVSGTAANLPANISSTDMMLQIESNHSDYQNQTGAGIQISMGESYDFSFMNGELPQEELVLTLYLDENRNGQLDEGEWFSQQTIEYDGSKPFNLASAFTEWTQLASPSSNADLSELILSAGDLIPDFDPSVLSYSVFVSNETEYIEVTVTPADSNAQISDNIDNEVALDIGETEIFITVTAEDGTVKQYTIVVNRLFSLSMVNVPAGSFQRDDDENNISVITQPFSMSKYQITQSQFEALMGVNPSNFSDGEDAPNRPVEMVSWYDAITFANKLSIAEGLSSVYSVEGVDFATLAYSDIPDIYDDEAEMEKWNNATADWEADGYRLPTEMEWMWAAMGADQDSYGNPMLAGVNVTGYSKPFAGYDGSNSIDEYAWYFRNSGDEYLSGDHDWNEIEANNCRTHPVGTKLPNELGLYDMSGNVWEWIWDWSDDSWPNFAITGTVYDHLGPGMGTFRRFRGGNWRHDESICAVANRESNRPWLRHDDNGFRLVRP